MEEAKIRQRSMLYGRRLGPKLRTGQQGLMDDLLPKLRVPVDQAEPLDLAQLFASEKTAYALEIGFGGGEHLAAKAALNPHIGYIGCEPFINGMAKLLAKIDQDKLTNIALYDDDARHVLHVLPNACLSQAYILYPDPWPKKRHHKRRFVSYDTLHLLSRVLKPGASLLIASDIGDYIRTSLLAIEAHPAFVWSAQGKDDWLNAPRGWVRTRYEAKAIREGRTPHYLQLVHRP